MSDAPDQLQARASEVHRAKDYAAAIPLWREYLTRRPDHAEAWANLGIALTETGATEGAEIALRRALALRPDAPWAMEQLGRLLHFCGRIEEALQLYERLAVIAPDNPRLRMELGYLHLTLGDFERGWSLYEARKDLGDPKMARLPMAGEWAGEPLSGRRLLIWPEQGFGDQIMMARFAPLLQAAGAQVTIVAPSPLVSLFQTLGVEVVERSGDMTLPQPDYWTLPFSIPYRLGIASGNVPAAPYLRAPEDRRDAWRGKAPAGGIGVLWRGNPTHPNDRQRSLPNEAALAPLKALGRDLVDLHQPGRDFADTAAIIEQLDVVVTVDSAVAHLAGAMGKPVYILLPWYRADWRWMRERADTPWYPTARLLRQPRQGDWASVVQQVAAML